MFIKKLILTSTLAIVYTNKSLTKPHPIIFDPIRLAVICKDCQHGVSMASLSKHLKEEHRYPDITIDSIKKEFQAYNPIGPADHAEILAAAEHGYSSNIKVHEGIACNFTGCKYHCITTGTIYKHLSQVHKNEPWPVNQPKYQTDVLVSTLFTSYKHYYPVSPPSPASSPSNPHEDDPLSELKAEYAMLLHECSRLYAIAPTEPTHLTCSTSLIRQPMEIPTKTVVGFFIASTSWTRSNRWAAPDHTTPLLSAIIYAFRMFTLFTVLINESPEDVHERLLVDSAKYLHDGKQVYFSEAFNLRLMGKTICRDFYQRETVRWNQTRTILTIDSTEIHLTQLYDYIRRLISSNRTELCTILGVDENYLEQFSPNKFCDNWNVQHRGVSIISTAVPRAPDVDPNFLDGIWRYTNRLISMPNSFVAIRNGKVQIDPKKQREFTTLCRRVQKFLSNLAVLLVYTGGLPMRGPELISTKHANDASTLRNVLLHFDSMVILSEYNKTDSIKGKPTVVARYLPSSVGQVVLCYLSELRPFIGRYSALQSESTNMAHLTNPLFFTCPEAAPITPATVSAQMGLATEQSLGVRVKIAKWRHVAVALYRERIQTEEDEKEIPDIAHILQTGHSEETDSRHYALTAEMITGTTDETLRAFYRVSKKWHTILGITDQGDATHPFLATATISPPTAPSPMIMAPAKKSALPAASMQQSLNYSNPLHQNKRILGQAGEPSNPNKRVCTTETRALEKLRLVLQKPDAEWRNSTQRDATIECINKVDNLMVISPPGSGKTLIFIIPAMLAPTMTTIVITPFISLQSDMISRCSQAGVQADAWHPAMSRAPHIVFVTPELAMHPQFQVMVQRLCEEKQLPRLVVDEVHCVVTDGNYRPSFNRLKWVGSVAVPLLLMTGTLPREMSDQVLSRLGCDLRPAVEMLHVVVEILWFKQWRVLWDDNTVLGRSGYEIQHIQIKSDNSAGKGLNFSVKVNELRQRSGAKRCKINKVN
ncbi:predicted protein [Histoplasma mississippiense (nom. inval.)]|uniref:predicted protein n=1 Tax=Ajellomyces capsulatus (strain NAm1 / WU24) TaxID=2059318 RepID=UPI000157C414|nr:predicted protein [Histoplasma mississippiense (nom. inval.)]EDN07529.1 predicted protein [Histoplasma mississippiense (nom. inval.)]